VGLVEPALIAARQKRGKVLCTFKHLLDHVDIEYLAINIGAPFEVIKSSRRPLCQVWDYLENRVMLAFSTLRFTMQSRRKKGR